MYEQIQVQVINTFNDLRAQFKGEIRELRQGYWTEWRDGTGKVWKIKYGSNYSTMDGHVDVKVYETDCLLYTSPSPRDS